MVLVLAPALGLAPRDASAHLPEAAAAAAVPAPGLPWSVEPWSVVCLFLAGVLYAAGLRRMRRRGGPGGRGVRAHRAWAFAGGWLATALALVGPLDGLAGWLFSAHMLQHEALMVVAAPLFVLGRPLGVWLWALPFGWRRRVGRFFRAPAWRRPWQIITSPPGAWAVHALALWLWHVPAAFEAALASNGVHTLQHFSFLFAALLYWWSVLGGGGRAGSAAKARQGWAMASLFTTMIHTGALGALLTLSPVPWYGSYVGRSGAFGLDPLEDQQLGGLVMWIPAGLAYVACGLMTALAWLDGGGRRTAPETAPALPPQAVRRA